MKLVVFFYVVCIIGLSGHLYQDKALEESMQRGSEIYADFCITCHLEKGEGVENVFPPLAQSDYLMNNRSESIAGVKYGQKGEIVVNGVPYNNVMMPMGLEDEEIADVMNYVLNSWGNSGIKMVTPEEVAAIEKK